MSIASQIDNESVKEWRERLPEVPLATPEEGDPFRIALPRAVAIGVTAAVLGSVAWFGSSVAVHSMDLFFEGIPTDVEPWWLAILTSIGILVVWLVALTLAIWLTVAVVGLAVLGYVRLSHLYANNPTAMGIGVVLAGSGMWILIMLLQFWARDFSLLPIKSEGDEWNYSFMSILKVAVAILIMQFFLVSALRPYFCRRRYCPSGSLFMRRKKVCLSASAAEQIAAAARSDAPLSWPDLLKASTEEERDKVKCTLTVYECERCAARLLEGKISVKCPERQKKGDATWRWLSTVIPREQGAAFEASLPKPSFWDRLPFRR